MTVKVTFIILMEFGPIIGGRGNTESIIYKKKKLKKSAKHLLNRFFSKACATGFIGTC